MAIRVKVPADVAQQQQNLYLTQIKAHAWWDRSKEGLERAHDGLQKQVSDFCVERFGRPTFRHLAGFHYWLFDTEAEYLQFKLTWGDQIDVYIESSVA